MLQPTTVFADGRTLVELFPGAALDPWGRGEVVKRNRISPDQGMLDQVFAKFAQRESRV